MVITALGKFIKYGQTFLSCFLLLTPYTPLDSVQMAYGSSAPYGTMTLGPNNQLVATQTAYEPTSLITSDFQNPQDLCYDRFANQLLVADTGNSRLVVLDTDGSLIREISAELTTPTGVSFDEEYYYVADKGAKAINVYDKVDGTLSQTIKRPETPLFGLSSPFVPTKIAVNPKGIYLVSEGATKGVIQLNLEGEFIGYVGANRTPMSFGTFLQETFFSEQQQESILKAAPPSPSNLAFNEQGLLYTITNGDAHAPIKKLNTLGHIIMSPSFVVPKISAVSIDQSNNIYGVTSDGQIVIYDSYGDLLFLFGEDSEYSERFGNLKSPTAITLLDNRTLFALDSETNAIVSYETTDFANLVFEAVDYYTDGLYVEGMPLWEEILALNGMFILSYRALAAANMKLGNYALALEQYRLAEDKTGYSEAFWQIRNEWIQTYLLKLFLILFALAIIAIAIRIIYRRTRLLDKPSLLLRRVKQNTFVQQMTFGLKFQKQPTDSVYKIKYESGAGVLTASILYVWFIALQIIGIFMTGFLFSTRNVYNTQILELVFLSVAPLFLWIIANYFVSTVSDGEGKLKHLYISTIYSLTPYLIGAIPIFLLSRILTLNEQFIYTFANIVMYGWCAVLLFKNYQEAHDYTFGKTIKNILLTAVCFVFFILAAYILYMLTKELFDYIAQVLREVF